MAEYAELHAAAQRALRGGPPLARAIGEAATDIDTRGLLRSSSRVLAATLAMASAALPPGRGGSRRGASIPCCTEPTGNPRRCR